MASQNGKINEGSYDDPSGRIRHHESLERYNTGGFHPTAIGNRFKQNRYVILRKLGFGGRSTVWLAEDKGEQGARGTRGARAAQVAREARSLSRSPSPGHPAKPKYVSLKIKSESSSRPGLEKDSEIAKLKKLESHYLSGPKNQPRTFVRLLDCFVHHGPNGKHNCLVTELLGPSLSAVMKVYEEDNQVLRPDTILRASKQLLTAIEFAHRAGLAHGDVSAANVVFTCNALQKDEDEDLIESLSKLVVAKAIGILPPRYPTELVATSIWDLWEDDPTEDIRLIDWGEAFPVRNTVPVKDMAQPLDLRAPETFFCATFDQRHDFWRAGCVIYNLVYQERVFQSAGQDHPHVYHMVAKLGPLPRSWEPKFQEIRSTNSFAEADEARIPKALISNTFESRRRALVSACHSGRTSAQDELDEHTDYDLRSLSQLERPMSGLLRYVPHDRITPQEACKLVSWTDYRRA